MAMIDGRLRLIVHYPAAEAGRFYFGAVASYGGRSREIAAEHLPLIVPELAPYVPLHGSNHEGVPDHVSTNAWYHAAGVAMPDLPEADRSGAAVSAIRFARLLRLPPDMADFHLARLARMAQEFGDWVVVRNEVLHLIGECGPRWQREASNAIVTLPTLLERIDQ